MREERKLTTKDLHNWKLIEDFLEILIPVASKYPMHPTFTDPRRTLGYASYLSLYLFGLFNPAVHTMRQLCMITELKKVQRTTGSGKVSLGSFSETQSVIDPDLLKQVFEKLVEQVPEGPKADPRFKHLELVAQDGSLWSALPRMAWAEYGVGPGAAANGVRLHLRFNILKDCPDDALVTNGKGSETQAVREMMVPGQTTVGDRLYGRSYRLFDDLHKARAFFVFRVSHHAVIHVEEELPMSAAEAQAGVMRHAWVHLGATEKLRSLRVRLVEVKREGKHLLLITNHGVEQLSAELVSAAYRRRWSIELFFRWIKCILGHRHFFAESSQGAALQMYLALIASVLLHLVTGERPNKRVMELLQFYFSGWATAEELSRLIPKYSTKPKSSQKG